MPRTKLSNGHAKSSNTQNHLAKKYSISYQKNTKIAMMIVKKF